MPDPYHQGHICFRWASGDQVGYSAHIDPDVSFALKVAATLGEDSWGTNVNQALRDLRYGD
ncbi:MAG: hypothetical protein AAGK21_00015 [Bacteroidota bacterium]